MTQNLDGVFSGTNALEDPDRQCVLCGLTRMDHGDSNHKFSINGELNTVEKGPEPKNTPPSVKLEHATKDDLLNDLKKSVEAQAVMRLTEVLIEKGILDGKDTMYIFSGFRDVSTP